MGHEPNGRRQQKAKEIPKNDAFQELLDKSPWTKASNNPMKSIKVGLPHRTVPAA